MSTPFLRLLAAALAPVPSDSQGVPGLSSPALRVASHAALDGILQSPTKDDPNPRRFMSTPPFVWIPSGQRERFFVRRAGSRDILLTRSPAGDYRRSQLLIAACIDRTAPDAPPFESFFLPEGLSGFIYLAALGTSEFSYHSAAMLASGTNVPRVVADLKSRGLVATDPCGHEHRTMPGHQVIGRLSHALRALESSPASTAGAV